MKYRTESIYGEGYREPIAVMSYECYELRNTDILRTLSSQLLRNHSIKDRLLQLADEIEDGTEIQDDTIFDDILNAVKSVTGVDVKYVLWLADTKDDVKAYALEGQIITDDEIDAYEESKIILSDCGPDGKLYGYADEIHII